MHRASVALRITNVIINIKIYVVMQGRGLAVNNCFMYEPC